MRLMDFDDVFDAFLGVTQPKKKRTFRENLERKAVLKLQRLLGIRDILTRLNDVERRLEGKLGMHHERREDELKDVRADVRALSTLLTKLNARSEERHRLLEQRMDRMESEK